MWGGSIIDRWDENVAAKDDPKRVAEPFTIAVNCWLWPPVKLTEVGLTETVGGTN